MSETVVTLKFSAGKILSFTADKDYLVTGFGCTTAMSLSKNPSQTMATLTSPSADDTVFDILTSHNSSTIRSILNIPVEKGTKLFVSSTAAGSAHIYLDDLSTNLS